MGTNCVFNEQAIRCCKESFLIGCMWMLVHPAHAVNLIIQARQPGVAEPVCVRAIIEQSSGNYVEGEWLRPTYPVAEIHGKAMAPDTIVQVPAGVTRITIGKGPDYLPQVITTNLTQDCTLDVRLQPALDLYSRGWRTTDMHVHYLHGEAEIIRTPGETWKICAAGGLNLVMLCEEHSGAGTLDRQQMEDLWKPYERTECQLALGVEEPKNAWGHHANILYEPWSIRSSPPYYLGMHTVHEQGGVSIPVHPVRLFPGRYYDDPSSGFRFWFLYPFNNFLKSYPLEVLAGHVLDGWSGVSDEPYLPQVLPPYFELLQRGYRIPLLADSDMCMDRVNNGNKASGFWMNYLHLEGRSLTRAAVSEAIRKGRVVATTGPLVLFTIDDAIPGDTLPPGNVSRTVRIQASYAFNPWTLKTSNFSGTEPCRITRIDLFRNGELFQTWNPNTPTAAVERVITETAGRSWYMVRVVGNEAQWMVGYASPIYFDSPVRPRQPPVFKPLIQGRLYDAVGGGTVTGRVACVRYGKTEWTIATDALGRFQARTPIDAELVAVDGAGRTFSQNILQQESVYAFCHYLADQYSANLEDSVTACSNIVRQMRWEFPLGYQLSASYVKTPLDTEALMSNFSVVRAPSPTPGKAHPEIVMLLVDKTEVQAGDTVNCAALYRSPQQPPSGFLNIEWKAWDTNHPSMFNRFSRVFGDFNNPSGLVDLGGGFYLRQASVVIPSWVANISPSTAAVQMVATVRLSNGEIVEGVQVLLRTGVTRRGLLVSTTWDGLPASWAEIGIGPCNFRRDYVAFQTRYADYRNLVLQLTLDGQPIRIDPKVDTAHVADADNAVFYEPFYFDGQCEPQFRNVPFRDPVRAQPPEIDFTSVPVQDPPDVSPPVAVAVEPAGGTIPAGLQPFYFLVDDAGGSGPGTATVLIDGQPVTNSSVSPVFLSLPQGRHTWQVRGSDLAGNSALSGIRAFAVGTVVEQLQTNTTVWVEDALPAGATAGADGGDSWNWITSSPAPFSGSLASQSNLGPGEHQHFFYGASETLNLGTNDVLFAYVYLDPIDTPGEVMLQWNNGTWEHRAFWGADLITNWGQADTPSRYKAGPLPPAGQWVPLAVSAGQVGLEGSVLNGMAFTLHGGRATWDYAGKYSIVAVDRPQISGGFSNGVWQVSFSVSGNTSFALERSTNLLSWATVTVSASAGQGILVLRDTNLWARAFYRVRLQPAP